MLIFYRNITTKCFLNRILTSQNIIYKHDLNTSLILMSKDDDEKKTKNPRENRKLNQVKSFSFIQLTPEHKSKAIIKQKNPDLESSALRLARLIIEEKEAAIVKLAQRILNNEIDQSKTNQQQIINEQLQIPSNEQIKKKSEVPTPASSDTNKLIFSAESSSSKQIKSTSKKQPRNELNTRQEKATKKLKKNLDARPSQDEQNSVVKNNLVSEQESAAIKLARLIDKEEPEKTADKLLKPIQSGSRIKNFKKKLKSTEPIGNDDRTNKKESSFLLDLNKIIDENKNEKKLLDLEDLDSVRMEHKQQDLSAVARVDMYSKAHNLNSGKGLDLFKQLDNLSLVDKTIESPIWSMHYNEELKQAQEIPPMNGFDEMIMLTDEGKLWTFPIDNEQGIDESDADVPFHEHIFLDHHLEQFPPIEPIQLFMTLALNGLSQNGHLTLGEKKEIINWYKSYFDEKLDIIKEALDTEARIQETYIQSSKYTSP